MSAGADTRVGGIIPRRRKTSRVQHITREKPSILKRGIRHEWGGIRSLASSSHSALSGWRAECNRDIDAVTRIAAPEASAMYHRPFEESALLLAIAWPGRT